MGPTPIEDVLPSQLVDANDNGHLWSTSGQEESRASDPHAYSGVGLPASEITSLAPTSLLEPSDSSGPTGQLCIWLATTTLDDIPEEVQRRARYLLLDGIGCLLVGAQLPWSRVGVQGVTSLDRLGDTMIAGWGRTTSASSAAMLNSSFIQGFELDDYFPQAPLHANSIVIPPLLATAEHQPNVTGAQFLLAAILGYEVGPRVGLALHGGQMLSRGWHSGVVFGPPAAAAAAGSLYRLSAGAFEDAMGIAASQSCGLMSAQFESMVKRMQHGFAARNGLYAAALAATGYVGIKQVFERSYGGFLAVFGEGHDPDPSQIAAELGTRWDTLRYGIKPYAAMAALHAAIDALLACGAGTTALHPDLIDHIRIDVGDAAFQHGGFDITRPIAPITAQMSLKYTAAVVIIDGAALVEQYSPDRINQDDIWTLVGKIVITHDKTFDESIYSTRVKLTMRDGDLKEQIVTQPRGGEDKPLTDKEIVTKYHMLTSRIIDSKRRDAIQNIVLTIDTKPDGVKQLINLLAKPVAGAFG